MSSVDLAEYIIQQINKLNMKRVDVAKQAGFSRETLNKLLRAEVVHPSTNTIVQLAHALNVAPLHLLRLAYGGSEIPLHSSATPKYPKDHSSFVRDITFPDNSIVSVNQEFEKIWEIQNTGHQIWEDRFLKCIDEDIIFTIVDKTTIGRLSSHMLLPDKAQIEIPKTLPGETVQLAVRFCAPAFPCTTISRWRMIDAGGDVCMPGLTGIWCQVTVMAL